MSGFNVSESIKAQKEYCDREGAPHFAPRNGVCWRCNKNIYEQVEQSRTLYWAPGQPIQNYTTGIPTNEAGQKLIIGCPHCNKSYCD